MSSDEAVAMSSNNSEVVVATLSDDAKCDESKCVSFSHALIDQFGYSPICYADDIASPMMCSHGYIPRVVDAEPSINHKVYKLGTFTAGCGKIECGGISYRYFTCCPPSLLLDINVSRHCSDPYPVLNDANSAAVTDITINNSSSRSSSTMVCEDENQQYPREMTHFNRVVESFMCCDSIIEHTNNDTANFLLDTECVPFSDESYIKSVAGGNLYGRIRPMFCNNKGIYSDFQFPRNTIIKNYLGIYYFHHYECCKTGSKKPPFIEDNTFRRTVYPQIAFSTVAVISCILLITALLIPLWLHVRKKRESVNTHTSVNSPTNTNQITGTNIRRTQGTMQSSTDLPFSGYNLYLVYLAIPDMILNIFMLGMYSTVANQKYNPTLNAVFIFQWRNHSFALAFAMACTAANLYLNCVISYEVLILLRSSYNATRCDPPSLVKVSLQAAFVYLFAILVFIMHYFIGQTSNKSLEQGDGDRFVYLNNVNFYLSLTVTYTLPIVFFSYVWITIWCCGYMPSATGRMKQLVWYFFRILVIFYVLWAPGMFLVVMGASNDNYGNLICIGYLFCGIQPIVSTCMAMSKADVRKYTKDLITLSYIRTVKD